MKSADDLQDEIAELKEILSRVIYDAQMPEYVGSNRWQWMNVTVTDSPVEPLDAFVDPTHAAIFDRLFESR